MERLFSRIRDFVKKAWSLVAILSIIFGFYAYFHEKKPDIQFTIIGDPNVFDVYKSVSDLEVYFQGKNVEKENLNLKVYTIKVENNGESDILKSLYDDNLPWGFSIENGDVVNEVRIVRSNSPYLDLNLKPKVRDGSIEFEKVIFEHGKYFVVELLVLHKKSDIPVLVPFGKIAGIDQFVVARDSEQEKKPVWRQLLDGSFIVHLTRWIVYTVISILLLLLLAFSSEKINQIREERIRKKRETVFQDYVSNEPILNPDVVSLLKDVYVRDGLSGLKKFRKELKNEKKLISEVEKTSEYEYIHSAFGDGPYHVMAGQSFPYDFLNFDKELLRRLILTSNDTKILDSSLKAELNKALSHLNKIDK